ncbi:MAG: phosphatidylserine decarboxylase [Fusobacteriaceae bacterium]|jgi:phosphatidylserine decarboxylase|nr:phosphatidylserine decarboxylase [Fusobacteriaceae bacterium]
MDDLTIRYVERKTGEILREKVPGEKWLRFLYHNPLGKLSLYALVRRKFLSDLYGKRMDAPASRKLILPFAESCGIDLSEAKKSPEDFDSFNDFFIRELKETARSVDETPGTLVSPADGKILAFERMELTREFFIKGNSLTVEKLFGERESAERFAEGAVVFVRLAPADYHRFHFPADGFVGACRKIEGSYYSVSPLAIRDRLDIFFENKREYALLTTKKAGAIALFEVGATLVGRITQTYRSQTQVRKGEEKGYFSFGGSTCILLFEKNKFAVDADILENTKKGLETKVNMGEKIGSGDF